MIPVDINRFVDRIEAIEAHPIQTGKVILYGSSFFARWGYEKAQEDFAKASDGKLSVLNHGFGGATIDELLRFYHRLIVPYKPSAVVIRSIFNEVHRGMSPEESIFLIERLLTWLELDYPGMPLFILKVSDNQYSTPAETARLHRANALLDAVAVDHSGVTVLDINDFFYEPDGTMRSVFVEDGLHLTSEAYEQMAQHLSKLMLDSMNQ